MSIKSHKNTFLNTLMYSGVVRAKAEGAGGQKGPSGRGPWATHTKQAPRRGAAVVRTVRAAGECFSLGLGGRGSCWLTSKSSLCKLVNLTHSHCSLSILPSEKDQVIFPPILPDSFFLYKREALPRSHCPGLEKTQFLWVPDSLCMGVRDYRTTEFWNSISRMSEATAHLTHHRKRGDPVSERLKYPRPRSRAADATRPLGGGTSQSLLQPQFPHLLKEEDKFITQHCWRLKKTQKRLTQHLACNRWWGHAG